MAASFAARQTARVFRGLGIFLIVVDFILLIVHMFLWFRAISRSYSDLTLDLNLAALHFVGNTVAILDLIGGITSFIRKSKQCTVKQVESTNCFLISLFTAYVDANAIARASLAIKDGVTGFDEAYRALTVLLLIESFMSMAWSVAVYAWSKAIEETSCEHEEDSPLGMEEVVTGRIASALKRAAVPSPTIKKFASTLDESDTEKSKLLSL
jgi:hypothetical protein